MMYFGEVLFEFHGGRLGRLGLPEYSCVQLVTFVRQNGTVNISWLIARRENRKRDRATRATRAT